MFSIEYLHIFQLFVYKIIYELNEPYNVEGMAFTGNVLLFYRKNNLYVLIGPDLYINI